MILLNENRLDFRKDSNLNDLSSFVVFIKSLAGLRDRVLRSKIMETGRMDSQ